MTGSAGYACLVVSRKDLGSWLGGPPPSGIQQWPGQRLGRPESGPGSIARPGRRVVALMIDWALSSLISAGFFGYDGFATLAVFAAGQILLVGTLGYSIGHRMLGMQVQTIDGRPAGMLAALVRTLLICMVIPAVVFDADQRGLHDCAMRTVLVRI